MEILKKQPILINKNECTGCSACANICTKKCIHMVKDIYGFSYPQVEEGMCVECGLCSKICPINFEQKVNQAVPLGFAAYSKNDEIRMESSSGGVFTEIAEWILEQNGIVFGAAYDENMDVSHICIESKEELSRLRGAKYSESSLQNIFVEVKQYLNKDIYVLFSGTPCQVAGLKGFLQKNYEKLFCIDFVCHGIPSPMAWKEYLNLCKKENQEVALPSYINLRSKKTGWSRYQYSHVFKFKSGKEVLCMNSESLYMKLFVGDYINRKSCEECRFKGYNRVSDFTIGDFWGIWDMIPEMDDNKGTSLLLLQSNKAREIWQQINSKFVYKEVTLEQTSRQNPSLLVSSKSKGNREEVLDIIRNGKIEECNKCFYEKEMSLFGRVMMKLKNILS